MKSKLNIAIVGVEWDIIDLIDSLSLKIAGFFDPFPSNFNEFTHFGSDEQWENVKKTIPDLKVALAIDDPQMRARLFIHYGRESIISLFSPHAHFAHRAILGHGVIIQRGVVIMPKACIGDGCKINVNVVIHHEAQIGQFCSLAPGAQILGRVVVGDGAYIGAGAIVRQRCKIGAGAMIGAGAVVVSDIPSGTIVVGVDAGDEGDPDQKIMPQA